MQWVLSPRAVRDLTEILDYIDANSPSLRVADKVQDDFEKAFNDLAQMPGIGRVRDELTGPILRWWRVHSYFVIYDPDAKPLRIIRVIHAARHLPGVMRDDMP